MEEFDTYSLDRAIRPYLRMKLGFGKYGDRELQKIPLRYLDETISVMPPTWKIRAVQRFVDLCIHLIHLEYHSNKGPYDSKLSPLSLDEILKELGYRKEGT